jgi:hypothetical protein
MAHKGKNPGAGQWFRMVAAGLAAVAVATAAGSSGHVVSVTSGGPAGCVVLRVTA